MNIIVPMMGVGQRFKDSGYTASKPMVKAYGKEILFWLLDELDCKNNNVLLVCRNDSANDRMLERLKSRYHDSVETMFLQENTEGAAHTVQIALNSGLLDLNEPIAVCDSDTFYSSSHVAKMQSCKNAVFYFLDEGKTPLFSYLEVEGKRIKRIAEKDKISDMASVGTYCFESGKVALEYCNLILKSQRKSKGEFYVSNVIQAMIDDGHEFEAVPVDKFTCLGTPAQLQGFKASKKLRVCFDIDNTLVSEPQMPGDYSSVEPITKNIEFLRFLKSQGHTIILQTARRMKTHGGNVGKLVAEVGKITFDTLEKFNIPYDEIYFGKPYADMYIDDKAIDCYGDLEKLMGVYQNDFIARDHNTVIEHDQIVKKSSNISSIEGELYWYLHMPKGVEHLFPKLFHFEQENDKISLEIEKIEGLTLSKMLTIGSIRDSHLEELVCNLKTIHDTCLENENVDICQNYVKKLDLRFSQIEDKSDTLEVRNLYNSIRCFLLSYESSGKIARSNIHGDPVFTNVIVDKNNRMKFIDMRGKQGNVLTITGDKNYDLAKVYQSLVGYDFLIRSMSLDARRLADLQDKFFTLHDVSPFIINGLTASLLFTCIPLQPKSIRGRLLQLASQCMSKVIT